jgi:hypothetical protein
MQPRRGIRYGGRFGVRNRPKGRAAAVARSQGRLPGRFDDEEEEDEEENNDDEEAAFESRRPSARPQRVAATIKDELPSDAAAALSTMDPSTSLAMRAEEQEMSASEQQLAMFNLAVATAAATAGPAILSQLGFDASAAAAVAAAASLQQHMATAQQVLAMNVQQAHQAQQTAGDKALKDKASPGEFPDGMRRVFNLQAIAGGPLSALFMPPAELPAALQSEQELQRQEQR